MNENVSFIWSSAAPLGPSMCGPMLRDVTKTSAHIFQLLLRDPDAFSHQMGHLLSLPEVPAHSYMCSHTKVVQSAPFVLLQNWCLQLSLHGCMDIDADNISMLMLCRATC